MNITVIAVGKIKEKYYTDAVKEYAKRLGRYCRLHILEVADEQTPDGAGQALEDQIRQKEGQRILKNLKEDSYVIALAIQGKKLSSEAFADKMEQLAISGRSHITFIIGGSLGLSPEVLKRADYLLSFSDMTFPHQLMRVVLLEQVYRCYRIIHHEPYHK